MNSSISVDLGHLARDLNLPLDQVQRTIALLDEGNTVPFVTRYRKDETGGLDRAIELVKERAKIPAAERIRLVIYPPRRSVLEQLFGTPPEAALQAALRQQIRDRLRESLPAWDLRMLDPGGMLRVMPFSLEIK